MHAETLRDSGRLKLPFAGYSVVIEMLNEISGCAGLENLNSADPYNLDSNSQKLFERLSGTIRLRASGAAARQADEWLAAPKLATASEGGNPRQTSLPVVIGSGSHPFPFRTRKLSLIPPMVLHGKLCGRVGRCRHYLERPDRRKTVGPFPFGHLVIGHLVIPAIYHNADDPMTQ